eukprot:91376-Pelagomonas_calceolata.AAC.4
MQHSSSQKTIILQPIQGKSSIAHLYYSSKSVCVSARAHLLLHWQPSALHWYFALLAVPKPLSMSPLGLAGPTFLNRRLVAALAAHLPDSATNAGGGASSGKSMKGKKGMKGNSTPAKRIVSFKVMLVELQAVSRA